MWALVCMNLDDDCSKITIQTTLCTLVTNLRNSNPLESHTKVEKFQTFFFYST